MITHRKSQNKSSSGIQDQQKFHFWNLGLKNPKSTVWSFHGIVLIGVVRVYNQSETSYNTNTNIALL